MKKLLHICWVALPIILDFAGALPDTGSETEKVDIGGNINYAVGKLHSDEESSNYDYKKAKKHLEMACSEGEQKGCDEYAKLIKKGY